MFRTCGPALSMTKSAYLVLLGRRRTHLGLGYLMIGHSGRADLERETAAIASLVAGYKPCVVQSLETLVSEYNQIYPLG